MYLHPHIAQELARVRIADLHDTAASRSSNASGGSRRPLHALLGHVVDPLRRVPHARMTRDSNTTRMRGAS